MSNEQQQNVPTRSYAYSRLFGTLYERGSPLEARINEAKAKMGDTAVKKGFAEVPKDILASVRGPELSGKSLAVGGNLKSVGVRKDEKSGEEYVWVCLRNREGRSFVSIPLNTDLGKQVVRKIANARVGEQLTMQPFGSLSEPKQGKVYGNHNVGMWQGDSRVEGLSLEPLREEVKKLKEKHTAAGIDEKTSRSAVAALELDWHRKVLSSTIERVNQHWESLAAERAAERAAAGEAVAGAAAHAEPAEESTLDEPTQAASEELDDEEELEMGLAR